MQSHPGGVDIKSNQNRSASGSRIGRPTREESRRRQEELLETALDIFLEKGFEQTTMAAIATAAGMSKRTVYAKYKDKEDLFKAALLHAIDSYTISLETLQALESGDLEKTLRAVARQRIDNVTTPAGVRLQRIVGTQSYRFPELFNAAFEQGTGPTINYLCDLFQRHNALGTTDIGDYHRAAYAFLNLVVGSPVRYIVAGHPLTEREIEERVRFSVGLFLNGVLKRG